MRVTNTSPHGCDLIGYPKITLLDMAGAVMAFTFRNGGDQMIPAVTPELVAIPAGGAAYLAINKNTCVLTSRSTATRIAVTLPGQTALLGPAGLSGMASIDLCGPGDPGARITVSPFEASAPRPR